jgi:hypothetical protein
LLLSPTIIFWTRRVSRAASCGAAANGTEPPVWGLAHHTANYGLENIMTFGKGALLWILGIPLPIIILLALFWR